eukprot:366208-Chlamydomonas_euryale.AAC.8
MCRDRRPRPIMPAEASVGPSPRTCMHVNAHRPPALGIYVHACSQSPVGLGLGRRDRPRPEAETNMSFARMNLPRLHIELTRG